MKEVVAIPVVHSFDLSYRSQSNRHVGMRTGKGSSGGGRYTGGCSILPKEVFKEPCLGRVLHSPLS
jgi:hypothetical protein